MSIPTLIINGIALPVRTRLDYQQSFERVAGGSSNRRMASGALFTMSHWQRWKTTISGSGWIPLPLLDLPIGTPFEVHSVGAIALKVGESLPPTWQARTDWPENTVVDEDGISTRLLYPILTVITLDGPRLVTGGSNPQWEIVCEEP